MIDCADTVSHSTLSTLIPFSYLSFSLSSYSSRLILPNFHLSSIVHSFRPSLLSLPSSLTSSHYLQLFVSYFSRLGILVNNQVCEYGGVSNIFKRYAVLKDNILNGRIAEEELENITNILYDHAVELERRGVLRLEELESLLRAGCEDNIDMWKLISKYFQEGEDENGFESDATVSEARTSRFKSWALAFDHGAWEKVTALVAEGFLPSDDARLIARFATGVGSPKLFQLKPTKHILYGLMAHCDWDDVLAEAERLVASLESKPAASPK